MANSLAWPYLLLYLSISTQTPSCVAFAKTGPISQATAVERRVFGQHQVAKSFGGCDITASCDWRKDDLIIIDGQRVHILIGAFMEVLLSPYFDVDDLGTHTYCLSYLIKDQA